MKVCSKCKTSKDSTEFYKSKFTKDGLKSSCISCANKYREDHMIWFKELKSSMECTICNESYHLCLEFHHLNEDEKLDTVSNLVCDCKSKQSILDEISKCIVVCANCHRKIHGGLIDISGLPIESITTI
jgi:hypothetical protein